MQKYVTIFDVMVMVTDLPDKLDDMACENSVS